MAPPPLPVPAGQVQLQLLDGGSWMPFEMIFLGGGAAKPYKMYDWAFYIFHPKLNRHILWDLGMAESKELYPPHVGELFYTHFAPRGPTVSVAEQLLKRSVKPTDVDTVLFSHAHWDHCRPVKNMFPNATGFFGPGTKEFCSPGHFELKDSQFDGAFFDPQNATENSTELTGPWVPFGPFERAMDFLGDGSLWLVDAPGHMPGNLFAAAHVGNGEWVILGGDCCHARSILDGTCDVAEFEMPGTGVMSSAHHDLQTAKQTISKLRQMENEYSIYVALAHDEVWMAQGTDSVLMGLLDEDMRLFVTERLLHGGDP